MAKKILLHNPGVPQTGQGRTQSECPMGHRLRALVMSRQQQVEFKLDPWPALDLALAEGQAPFAFLFWSFVSTACKHFNLFILFFSVFLFA